MSDQNEEKLSAIQREEQRLKDLIHGMTEEDAKKLEMIPFRGAYKMKPPALDMDWKYLSDLCIKRIVAARNDPKVEVVIPIREYDFTKKNKARLSDQDKTSPLGIILKGDEFARANYRPYASARFDAYEVVRWISLNFPDALPEGDEPDTERGE